MNIFRTKKGQSICLVLLAVLLIGAVIIGISLKNQASLKQNSFPQQTAEVKKYKPEFKKMVKDRLGVEPNEIEFNFDGSKKDIKSVKLFFSNADVTKYPFLKSSVFKSNKTKDETKEYISTQVYFDEEFPPAVTPNEIFKLKLHELTTQIYFALLDKVDFVASYSNEVFKNEKQNEPLNKQVSSFVVKSGFYQDINKKQTKKLLQNYAELEKLNGNNLAKRLLSMDMMSYPSVVKNGNLMEPEEIVSELGKYPYLYIKKVREQDLGDELEKIVMGKTMVYMPDKKSNNSRDKSSSRLNIVSYSRSKKDSNKDLESAELTKMIKIDENTYEGLFHPSHNDYVGNVWVRIKTKL